MKVFYHIGHYFIFILKVFSRPEKTKILLRSVVKEMDKLGINSLGIVIIISIFMGAVITIQTAYNTEILVFNEIAK